MTDTIDISGLDKAAVLAALHNATHAIGMGRLHDIGRPMTVDEARVIIGQGDDHRELDNITKRPALYFDYVQGRPLKVNIGGDSFDPWLFDRDAGQGAARRAIDALRSSVEQSAHV